MEEEGRKGKKKRGDNVLRIDNQRLGFHFLGWMITQGQDEKEQNVGF